jgi:hypothetical protein
MIVGPRIGHQRAKALFPIMVKGTWAYISRKFHR